MIRALGWGLVGLWLLQSAVIASLVGVDGLADVLVTVALTMGLGLLMLAAFFRGRSDAHREVVAMLEEETRAREAAGGNGGA